MTFDKLSRRLLLAVLMASPQATLACHELVVTTGKGLTTQAYIAPNPAEVLILYTDASHDREFAGLERAGHRLTLVADVEELVAQLARQSYDIVITPLAMVDTVTRQMAAENSARVLPIVSRGMRRDTEVRDRFDQFLVGGGGVAKFLTVINRVLAS